MIKSISQTRITESIDQNYNVLTNLYNCPHNEDHISVSIRIIEYPLFEG